MSHLLNELGVWVSAVVICIYLLGLWNAAHAVMNVRSSQGAIAWSMVLLIFPWIALPFYWILGRWKFQGYVEAFQEAYQQHRGQTQRLYKELLTYETVLPAPWATLNDLGRSLTGIAFTAQNSIQLLQDGEQTFQAMLGAIAQAQDYILLQTYILKDDQIGKRFQQALIERVRHGVRVYLLFDAIGGNGISKRYLEQLRQQGIQVAAFRSTRGWRHRFQVNFRNHRKLLIVDGQTGFAGGLNIGDEYLGKDPRFGDWRDTHIQLWGPSVHCLQLTFFKDWYWSDRTVPAAKWQVNPSQAKDAQTAFVFSPGPAEPIDDCTHLFCHMIHMAQKRLWIASPYFVPDEPTLTALKTAALRGVEVRILLPDRPDHLLVYLSSFSYYDEMQVAGISLYRYQPGFMHQKVMLVDEAIAAVGTVNLDNRSFRLNFEVMTFVHDLGFAKQVEGMLQEDFSQSYQVDFAAYQRRWTGFKLMVQIARLMAPLQ